MSPIDVFMFSVFGAFILGGFAAGIAFYRYTLRVQADATALARERLDAQVALKRELIQRGLPPDELEQAIKLLKLDESLDEPPAAGPHGRKAKKSEQQIEAGILESLALLDGISAEDVEKTFGLLRIADQEKKAAALDLVEKLRYTAATADVVLAAVRSLCRSADKPREDGKPLEISSHITR